jgi:RNA polymerase sigma factor (sigma-70 family)
MESDKEIVAGMLAGDRDAFRHVVARYQRLVAHVVAPADPRCDGPGGGLPGRVPARLPRHRRLPVRREALDLDRAPRVPRLAQPPRKEAAAALDDLPDAEQTRLEPTSGAPDPLEAVVAGEMRGFVRRSIDALPVQYRAAVTLYHLEEMTIEEIATAMELPAGTIKSHLFRARRLLKDALRERYSGEEIGK